MVLFDKRGAQGGESGGGSDGALPVQRIRVMREQGLTNNQIVQALQRDGFSTSQIFDAMNQLDIEPPEELLAGGDVGVGGSGEAGGSGDTLQWGGDGASHTEQVNSDSYASEGDSLPGGGAGASRASGSLSVDPETEELIEAIVDEKWNELLEDVKKIVAWKSAVETIIHGLEERSKKLYENMELLTKDVHAKLEEYDSAISALHADLKALEKVYAKILPLFVEKVAFLQRRGVLQGKKKEE